MAEFKKAFVLGSGGFFILAGIFVGTSKIWDGYTSMKVKQNAKNVVNQTLKDPDSARHDMTILATGRKGEREIFIVHDRLRAQNSFGAYSVESYCIYYESDDEQVYILPGAIQKCGENPSPEQIIAFKAMMGWPTPNRETASN